MLPRANFFGEPERLLGSTYPYRVPLGVTVLVVLGLIGWQVQRCSQHRTVARWVDGHRAASAVAGAVLLGVVLPLGNYILSPLWEREVLREPSPIEAAGAAPRAATGMTLAAPAAAASNTPRVLREGSLRGADAFHFGRGRVLLVDTGAGNRVVSFEGASVRNGPDLFVYLSPSVTEVGTAVNLGPLKATDGDFNYEVPTTIEGRALANVVVWCRQFGVLFASAALSPTP